MASRHQIIKQIEALIAENEQELERTDKANYIAVAHLKSQIRKLKMAVGLIK